MGAITWGINRDRLATVFCMNCRSVFAREVSANEAAGIVECASKQHHCIPPKPWRPAKQ